MFAITECICLWLVWTSLTEVISAPCLLQVWLPFLFQKIELQIAIENYKFFIYESLLSSTEGIKALREMMQHVTPEGGLIFLCISIYAFFFKLQIGDWYFPEEAASFSPTLDLCFLDTFRKSILTSRCILSTGLPVSSMQIYFKGLIHGRQTNKNCIMSFIRFSCCLLSWYIKLSDELSSNLKVGWGFN